MRKYFTSARTITSRILEMARPHNPLRIRSGLVANSTPVATVRAEIDATYPDGDRYGYGYVLTIHDLLTSRTVGNHWSIANFQAIVDYIPQGDTPALTMSDALARMAV